MSTIDELDARLLNVMRENPRVGILETARLLGVARGTVQARLDRLERTGVLTGWGPDVDLVQAGWPLLAFISLEISQGQPDDAVDALRAVPEVIEVFTTTGNNDLLCRIGARSTEDLQRILQVLLSSPWVRRASTQIALSNPIAFRVDQLLAAGARPSRRTG